MNGIAIEQRFFWRGKRPRPRLIQAGVLIVRHGDGEDINDARSGLVAAMLASRDFKGIRRKRLPIFMLGADHAFQASFER